MMRVGVQLDCPCGDRVRVSAYGRYLGQFRSAIAEAVASALAYLRLQIHLTSGVVTE